MHSSLFALSAFLARSVLGATVSSVPQQKIYGIGASAAWWPIDVYPFPDSVKKNVSSLLFTDAGMKMTSYRYNVGGGGVFVGTASRAPETMFVSPGVLNTSADPQGSYFLRAAAAADVPIITAFVNSAPPSMTSVNRSCGGTLLDASTPDLAQYLADAITYWKTQNVRITHVSPMNEPDSSFGGSTSSTECGQEGMIVKPSQRAEVVRTLRTALDAAGLQSVGIIADESSNTSNFFRDASTWLGGGGPSLAAVAHHNYGFANDATDASLGSTARNLSGGVYSWFTETCCFRAADGSSDPAASLTYGANYDPTIVSALQTANLIWQGFTQALDAHFSWWLALSSGLGCDPVANPTCPTTTNSAGWNDGLIYYNGDASSKDYTLYLTKRFWIMKHFAAAIPVGSTRHNVTDLPAGTKGLALDRSGSYSVLLLHLVDTTEQVTVDLSGFAPNARVISARQTTGSGDWVDISSTVSLKASLLETPLNGYSVTTVILE